MKLKIIFSFFLVLMVSVIISGCSNGEPVPGDYDVFAQCLTEKDIKMYGTEWCGYCKRQKEAFGSSFEFVDYVDCDMNEGVCDSEGITNYPTWIVDGRKHVGLKDLEQLSSLSGCPLT